jgi:hypothetical protein
MQTKWQHNRLAAARCSNFKKIPVRALFAAAINFAGDGYVTTREFG